MESVFCATYKVKLPQEMDKATKQIFAYILCSYHIFDRCQNPRTLLTSIPHAKVGNTRHPAPSEVDHCKYLLLLVKLAHISQPTEVGKKSQLEKRRRRGKRMKTLVSVLQFLSKLGTYEFSLRGQAAQKVGLTLSLLSNPRPPPSALSASHFPQSTPLGT